MVDQRADRDRFCKLQKDFKRKRAYEERANGICPDEPDELDQALEDISEMEQSQQEELKGGKAKKKAEGQKEHETADLVRKRAMQRMGETRAREGESKKRRHDHDTVQ